MGLFKRKRRTKDGMTESSTWTLNFKDHLGVNRRISLFSNKKASEETARKIEQLVEYRMSSIPLTPEQKVFLESCSGSVLTFLAKHDIVASEHVAATQSIREHIDCWCSNLLGKGKSKRYIDQSASEVHKVCNSSKFVFFSDIKIGKIENYLAGLKEQGKSHRTINSYLTSFKNFLNYCVRQGLISENPVRFIPKLNVKVDRRIERRALLEEEVNRLLNITAGAADRHGLTGEERALVYQLALYTGLRYNEIRTLTWSDIDLERGIISLRAENEKARRGAVIPLTANLVESIKKYFWANTFSPVDLVFAGLRDKGARMLRSDLKEAHIEFENASGKVDFHSLRHTYGSMLAKAGVHPKMAQELMRHSDINLTMNIYTHTVLEDKLNAVESLPVFGKKTKLHKQYSETFGENGDGDAKINSDRIGMVTQTVTQNLNFDREIRDIVSDNDEVFLSENGNKKITSTFDKKTCDSFSSGTPERIRTPNLLIRSQNYFNVILCCVMLLIIYVSCL